jgi:hypothetical protein
MLSNSVNAVKCQYRAKPVREGVETRRQPSRTDEGIVQTTNCKGSESYSGKKISRLNRRAGSIPATRTTLGFKVFTDARGTVTAEEGDRYPLEPPRPALGPNKISGI